MKFGLGLCYEFTLHSGAKKRLKFLGGNPLGWQDAQCNFFRGPLDTVLGDALVSCVEIKCWQCPKPNSTAD